MTLAARCVDAEKKIELANYFALVSSQLQHNRRSFGREYANWLIWRPMRGRKKPEDGAGYERRRKGS